MVIKMSENKEVIDERSIIIEQERLKREQKKRKNRKKKRITIAILSFLAIGGVWYGFWGRNLQVAEKQNQVDIIAGAGEEIIFAQLISVNGNEITYTIAEKSKDTDAIDPVEDETMFSPNDRSGGGAGNKQGSGPRGGKMPDQAEDFVEGEMPDMDKNFVEGERPDMAENFVEGEMPDMEGGFIIEGGLVLDGNTTTNGFTYNGITYNLTEETNTTFIPVGTDVTTKLGAVTTFSRLAAGDNVALVVSNEGDEQIILGIYIIG